MKKKLSIVLAVVLTLTLLLTSLTFAGEGKNKVAPARMVLDASLSEVSTTFDTPKANLEVARSRAFSFGGGKFLLSSIVDKNSKQAYMVSTDAQGKVWIAEPKIDDKLIDYMSQMKPDETVSVSIWAIYVRPEEELRQIPSKYPDVSFEGYSIALGADVSLEVLDAIEADATEIKLRANAEAVQPVVDFLQSTGSTILYVSEYAPTVGVELSKEDVYKLARLPEVESISLPPGEPELCMDQASQNLNANNVWDEGYDGGMSDGSGSPTGTQTKVAVVDLGVDFGHENLAHANGGEYTSGYSEHGTAVAGIIASNHEAYTGIAPGTKILDANYHGLNPETTWDRIISATDWALNEGADIINLSSGFPDENGEYNGNYDSDLCRYFDHIAFEHRRLAVCAAGNDRYANVYCTEPYYVESPANAYNVLAVGGIDDKGDLDWTNDDIWWLSHELCPQQSECCCQYEHLGYTWKGSSGKNPIDGREKPEVCAPAVGITTAVAETEDEFDEFGWGTSFAAPQVSGIAALLIEKNPTLRDKPELLKAIIMATAIHRVGNSEWEEDNDPPSYFQPIDMYEGVGTVDAYAAYKCVEEGWIHWVEMEIDEYEDVFEIQFDLEEEEVGNTVRFVLNWLAHTDYQGDGSGLYEIRTDLGLQIFGPHNIPCGYSLSDENPWEIVQFTAPYEGTYRALVPVSRFSVDGSWERIGAAWYSWNPDVLEGGILYEESVIEDFEWGIDGYDLDTSGGEITWHSYTEGGSSATEIDASQKYHGTRSGRWYRDGTHDIYAYFEVPYLEYISYYLRWGGGTRSRVEHGNGSYRLLTRVNTDGNIQYYAGAGWQNTGNSILADTWYHVEIRNINWVVGTYDIYIDDDLVKSSTPMYAQGSANGIVRFHTDAGTGEFWIDDIFYEEVVIVIEDFEWGSDGASLAISGGVVDWQVSTPGSSKAEIDTARKVSGTRSARIYRDGSNSVYARHWQFQPDRISFYLSKDYSSCADIINGDGAHRIVVRIPLAYWYPTNIQYYDGTYHDTGYTIYPNYWYFIELRNIDWEAATYNIYVNNHLVKYKAAMHTSSASNGYIYFGSWAGWNSYWIDYITG